jgi:hypothetical protein
MQNGLLKKPCCSLATTRRSDEAPTSVLGTLSPFAALRRSRLVTGLLLSCLVARLAGELLANRMTLVLAAVHEFVAGTTRKSLALQRFPLKSEGQRTYAGRHRRGQLTVIRTTGRNLSVRVASGPRVMRYVFDHQGRMVCTFGVGQ